MRSPGRSPAPLTTAEDELRLPHGSGSGIVCEYWCSGCAARMCFCFDPFLSAEGLSFGAELGVRVSFVCGYEHRARHESDTTYHKSASSMQGHGRKE